MPSVPAMIQEILEDYYEDLLDWVTNHPTQFEEEEMAINNPSKLVQSYSDAYKDYLISLNEDEVESLYEEFLKDTD